MNVAEDQPIADPLLERVPPHSVEAEMSLLGSMMLDAKMLTEVSLVIQPSSFYVPAHRQIAAVLWRLAESRTPCDIVTMVHELKSDAMLEEVGGVDYIARLAESVPSAANADTYAKIVRDMSDRREAIGTCGASIRELFLGSHPHRDTIHSAVKALQRIVLASEDHRPVRVGDVIVEIANGWAAAEAATAEGQAAPAGSGCPVPWQRLRSIVPDLLPGQMIVLGGRPSHGKTAIALDMARHAAAAGKRTVIFSLEMLRGELGQRLIGQESGVALRMMRPGSLFSVEMQAEVHQAMERLLLLPMLIDDQRGQDAVTIAAKCQQLANSGGPLGLVIVDYLQLVRRDARFRQTNDAVADISYTLKSLAGDLACPVLVLSQLNREIEHEKRHPRLSDLRDSGAIEQDADTVMFLWRPKYQSQYSEERASAELIVAKQRSGPTGECPLRFDESRVSFVEDWNNGS